MLCSTCGYENQVGHRFCGMCGTPLPHRPLTTPGAQGTHNFTRVPSDRVQQEREVVATPREQGPAAPGRSGVLIEMPRAEGSIAEPPLPEGPVPPATDMVPEMPLDEYVRSFRYVPPADPQEITMRGEAQVLESETSAVTDLVSTNEVAEANAGSANEDLHERLGLEEAARGDERRDRPRFLEFSGSTPPPEPAAPQTTAPGPSFLPVSDAPQIAAQAAEAPGASRQRRGSGWTWLAVAALVAFVTVGVLERRAQVNQTNTGPLEIARMKLEELRQRFLPAPQPAVSADATASRPQMPAEEQDKPQAPDQNTAANPNISGSTVASGPPASSDSNAGNNTATLQQSPTTSSASQPSDVRKPITTAPNPSISGTQAATGPRAALPKPALPNDSVKAIGSNATVPAQGVADKPKSKPPAVPPDTQDAAVKAVVPGEDDLAKANDASDSAAAAAWLWKATAKGNPDAPVRLADMYVKGDGVPRSCEQALVLLKTAATKENAVARNRLAAMYSNGTCVQRNRVEAYHWLSSALAADPNSHWAQENRDVIWQQMTPEERAAAQQYR